MYYESYCSLFELYSGAVPAYNASNCFFLLRSVKSKINATSTLYFFVFVRKYYGETNSIKRVPSYLGSTIKIMLMYFSSGHKFFYVVKATKVWPTLEKF